MKQGVLITALFSVLTAGMIALIYGAFDVLLVIMEEGTL